MHTPASNLYKDMKDTVKERVKLDRSLIAGWGLFAAKDIPAGTMVIEYVGEIIRHSLSNIRENVYNRTKAGNYLFAIDDHEVIDATYRANCCRFINHCCTPNCLSQVITVEKKQKIIIISKQDIMEGEELSYDYFLGSNETKVKDDDTKMIDCGCRSEKCRKKI